MGEEEELEVLESEEEVPKVAKKPKEAKTFADNTVIRGPDGAIYVMQSGLKRLVPDRFTYIQMGINAHTIVQLKEAEIEAIPEGNPMPRMGPRRRR